MENKHSVLSPSSAARRVKCPGSRALEARFPEDQDSPESKEGNAAHWVAAEMLKGELHLIRNAASSSEKLMNNLGQFVDCDPNGEPITKEMISGAQFYFSEILALTTSLDNDECIFDEVVIEEKIDIHEIHLECWGTPDAWIFHNNELFIYDYKFGHKFVEVFENWQLIEYASGILRKLRFQGLNTQHAKVTFCIIQPRSYHREGPIRTWEISVSGLELYFNTLRKAEEEAMKYDAACFPNSECDHCLGRHACEALQCSALSTIDLSSSNTPHLLNANGVGNELRFMKRAAELLDARITGLEEQAIATIKRGERVPFFGVEESVGRERWKKSAEEIIIFGELLGSDLSKPRDVITPKQAIKMGMPETLVREYSETPRGTMKLVSENSLQTRKLFNKRIK